MQVEDMFAAAADIYLKFFFGWREATTEKAFARLRAVDGNSI